MRIDLNDKIGTGLPRGSQDWKITQSQLAQASPSNRDVSEINSIGLSLKYYLLTCLLEERALYLDLVKIEMLMKSITIHFVRNHKEYEL